MKKLTYTQTDSNGKAIRKEKSIETNAVEAYKEIKEGEDASKRSPILKSYTTSDFRIENK